MENNVKEQKQRFMIHHNVRKTERDKAKDDLHVIGNVLKDCKIKESEVKAKHEDPSRCQVMNYIESAILKKHKIQRSCYHDGDLEGNDVMS